MPPLVPRVVPPGRMSGTDQPVLAVADDLVLRPWTAADAPTVLEAFNDPVIQRWHTRTMDSEQEALAWIAGWAPAWSAETDACWAISRADTDGVLGRIALRDVHLAGGSAECTYWMLPAARGLGIVPRAAITLADWALNDLGLHRLWLAHSVRNMSSCRVASKAGFELEGTMRSHHLHTDGWHDMHLHARVQTDR